jgi:hypothetical protein
VGAITVRRTVVGNMSAAVFALGILAFLLGFVEPWFFPVAWASLAGGGIIATVLRARNRRAFHPTLLDPAGDAEERNPVQPR